MFYILYGAKLNFVSIRFLCRYMFTMRQISEAIQNAKKRGVRIRIIADSSMIATSGTQINILQQNGKYIALPKHTANSHDDF